MPKCCPASVLLGPFLPHEPLAMPRLSSFPGSFAVCWLLLCGVGVLAVATTGPLVSRADDVAKPPALKKSPAGAKPNAGEGVVAFETDVRLILKANCFHCHGDEEKPEAGLDLRLVRFMSTGGESGPAIKAGEPHTASLLWKRIANDEMPPGEKKLTAREKAVIAKWLNAGAKTAAAEPTTLPRDGITEFERSHWAYQPVARPSVPEVSHKGLVRTPVDAFLLETLEEHGLSFSPEADRLALLRRASFDLLGLPPSPEEIDEFLKDSRADAYERLVDRLLSSPHYGERWARHWLDVAGYADSDGFGEKDLERKWAFKYRDYLIKALNNDRPWNELLIEQLAGDELLKPPFKNLTPEEADRLVATGFLRMAPDGTGDTAVDQGLARNECVAETLKIVSTSLLGLTVGCAQCHNHRYDPISQLDYYRLRAVFEPALNPKAWRPPAGRLVSLWTAQDAELAKKCDAEIKRLEKDRLDRYQALSDELREKSIAELPDDLKEKIREAAKTPVAKRTAEQKKLLVDHPKAAIPVGTLLERNARVEYKAITDEFAALIAEQTKKRPVDDFAHCLTEIPGQIPTTHLFHRGEFAQPKQEVTPAELTVLASRLETNPIPVDDPELPTTGRRLAYAKYLTSGEHPLVGRVFVNRVWLHHFGKGLVNTPGDFGKLGETPSHPELLDWLASTFVREGWSLKKLHRLMMTSTAYRQYSQHRPELDAVDPENRWLGRMPLRRLEAEETRDAILSASGLLNRKLYGPPVPVTPDETGQVIVGVDTRDGAGRPTGRKVPLNGEEYRRSLYIQVRRSLPLAMLETFDAAALNPNCVLRNASTVAPQSLMLMNNEFTLQQAELFADRVLKEGGASPDDRLRYAWRLAMGRDPSPDETRSATALLTRLLGPATTAPTAPATATSAAPAPPTPAPPERRGFVTLCHALLISNGFLYID